MNILILFVFLTFVAVPKLSGTEHCQISTKTNTRPARPTQDMDIMACQDSKASDAVLPRSKEPPPSEQSRKKRITGDPKLNHTRQKLTEMTSAKAASHSKKSASGEPRVEDTPNPVDCEGESQDVAAEDRTSEASDEKGPASAKSRKVNASQSAYEEGDYDDDYSTSEETSISSGCSSTGSLGRLLIYCQPQSM